VVTWQVLGYPKRTATGWLGQNGVLGHRACVLGLGWIRMGPGFVKTGSECDDVARVVPYDAGWLSRVQPESRRYLQVMGSWVWPWTIEQERWGCLGLGAEREWGDAVWGVQKGSRPRFGADVGQRGWTRGPRD
jgi:hypothetical protein